MEETNITADHKDVQDNKIMAILAYFWILFLVPLLAAKESPFARFHANQGCILFITWTAFSIIYYVVIFILAIIAPKLAIIGSLLGLIFIVFLVLMIIGIINAAKGEMKELPIIGKYRIIK